LMAWWLPEAIGGGHLTLVLLTFSVVLFSLLAQGLTVGKLLKKLGLAETQNRESEYQRLASELLACQAALKELERLQAEGVLPRPACESVKQEYHRHLQELEEGIEALHLFWKQTF